MCYCVVDNIHFVLFLYFVVVVVRFGGVVYVVCVVSSSCLLCVLYLLCIANGIKITRHTIKTGTTNPNQTLTSLSIYSEHILHDSDVFKTLRLQSYETNYNERYCPVVPRVCTRKVRPYGER